MSKVVLSLQYKSDSIKEVYNSLLADFSSRGRADVTMTLLSDSINFEISSDDLTSVRATINSIILRLRGLNEIDNLKL